MRPSTEDGGSRLVDGGCLGWPPFEAADTAGSTEEVGELVEDYVQGTCGIDFG
jgi:hypothetical protein